MDIGQKKKLPFTERRRLFQEKVKDLVKEYDVDIMSVISMFPQSIQAQILYIDLQNAEMLKNLGLAPNPLIKKSGEKQAN